MEVETNILGPLIAVVLGVIALYIAFKVGKFLLKLILNSIAGLALLWILNALPFIYIPMTFWNILIVAFGGVFGLALVIVTTYLGIPL